MSRARHRGHAGYRAFLAHRISGIGLALFLPFHFLVLALALEGPPALEEFLRWSDRPSIKFAEALLVVLLSVHLAGGLRLLAIEFLPWSDRQARIIAFVFGAGLLAGLLFLFAA
jgi:fumarate reductase subunit D